MTLESATPLDGKVILVTGGTEGIGKAAARAFARAGATLVLVGRNREKTDKVVAELKEETGNAKVESILGDLAAMSDIRAVATAFKARHDRLDVLVNNAGGVFMERKLTADGLEHTFALNHLGYFLLTHELRDVLAKTPGARVVSTSSGAHSPSKLSDIDEAAHRAKGYSGWMAYSDSKLANILFTRELARRLDGTGVAVSCFHPGFVQSGFGMNNRGLVRGLIKIGASLFARDVDKGAETLVWLATSPDAAGAKGEYYHDLKARKTSRRGQDDELARRLWTYSEELCGIASA